MKLKNTKFARVVILSVCVPLMSASGANAEETAPKVKKEMIEKVSLKSINGYIATYSVENSDAEDRASVMLIKRNKKVLSKIHGASPVAFNPKNDVLIVREMTMDDDTQHYVLNIGKGEYSKMGQNRLKYVFGGRWATDVKWSEDGKSIIVTQHKDMVAKGDDGVETILLKDLLKKK